MTEKEPSCKCPRCECYVSGEKGPYGCSHCGHLNGRDEETRFDSAIEQITELAKAYWSTKDECSSRYIFNEIQRVVWQTMTRPDWDGTYKKAGLAFEPAPTSEA